jgi:hypothetical protein
MIVRILGEGQYAIDNSDRGVLDGLDATLMETVDGGDEEAFGAALASLIAEVRRLGRPVPDDNFSTSDLVVPFSDSSLEETKGLLAEPGADAASDDR